MYHSIVSHLTKHEDFPKKGIVFRDISPLLTKQHLVNYTIDTWIQQTKDTHPEVIVGIESRGYIFGILLANKLNLPFVMARKPGKLPGKTIKVEVTTEYSVTCLEMQDNNTTKDVIKGKRVLIVDDIVVTGGTIRSTDYLINRLSGQSVGVCCILQVKSEQQLEPQHLEKRICSCPIYSIVKEEE